MRELLTRQFSLAPGTLNRDAGTVDATLSTGAPVARQGYVERLAVTPDAVEIARHVPILDAHRQGSIRDVLGRVDGVRFEPGSVVGTLRITSPAALAAVERGDITGVSMGYRVASWAESQDAAGARTKTATRWALAEVSLVPLPADPGATVRSNPTMSETEVIDDPARTVTRAAINGAIRQLATKNGLTAAWADRLIDREATVEAAREAALDAMAARGSAPAIRTAQTDPTGGGDHLKARSKALAHRMAPSVVPLTDKAKPYQHYTIRDHARDLLQLRGESTTGLSPDQIITRAMNTVADFPGLLASTGNRTLAPPYQAALSPLRALFREATAIDFRPKIRLALSEHPQLLLVNETGEIKYGSRGENKETYGLETYGRLFSISRQALINDDLGAFADMTRDMAAAAAETENALRASFLITGNGNGPSMADGLPLFHAKHGNLGAPAALSVASLSAARAALRNQKGLDGVTPIGVTPVYLLVGPALETAAEQLLSTLSPVTVGEVNPFNNGRLTLLVEPRLTGTAWYLFAAPAQRAVFEQAHLSAAPGPQMASKEGWDTLGVEFRVYLDYGAGVIDWRGAYRNPGA